MSKSITTIIKPTDYKIIQGLPLEVEQQVKSYISMGWELCGEMYVIKTPTEHVDVVVQGMVLYYY